MNRRALLLGLAAAPFAPALAVSPAAIDRFTIGDDPTVWHAVRTISSRGFGTYRTAGPYLLWDTPDVDMEWARG